MAEAGSSLSDVAEVGELAPDLIDGEGDFGRAQVGTALYALLLSLLSSWGGMSRTGRVAWTEEVIESKTQDSVF